jgi:carbohydrate-selective porin OprB
VTSDVRVFGRAGWNEPHFESFAYTEVNDTIESGAEWIGARWKRPHDKIGAALVSNGISADHQRYLALGGSGFLLGDGALRYGREQIVETYYNAHIWRSVFASGDLQRIVNPGYNRDRGPVVVTSLRLHIEL